MVTLMRFNIFLIFLCIFIYLIIKLNKYKKLNNIILIKDILHSCMFFSILFIFSLTLLPITLVAEKSGVPNLIPFSTILSFIKNGAFIDSIFNLLGNIVLFVPLGFFSYIVYNSNKKKSICLFIITTLLVEVCQLFLPLRKFDVDDLILNSLGGFIGMYICILLIYHVKNKARA